MRRFYAVDRRRRRVLVVAVVAIVAPWALLVLLACLTPLPSELRGERAMSTSVVLRDKDGVVLRELAAADGSRARWLPFSEFGDALPRALVGAEDRRFLRHPGVDPLAIARALGQLVTHGRVVSGASTLTQQLAKNLRPHPRRSLAGKVGEMALALRIEASLDKRRILEEYGNRVEFAPGLRGVEAASRYLFDKTPSALSLAEAAALASLPRGPSLYDPSRGVDKLKRRRDRVLARMKEAGLASAADVERALAEPLVIATHGGGLGAPHLVRAVMSGAVDDGAGAMRNRASDVTLTIDRDLQRELEVVVRERVLALRDHKVGAGAVVVLENATGKVLAYVGSTGIDDAAHLGENDGALALRQPGSALKPFVYELAMERLGMTAATALADVELELPTKDGSFRPNDYDGRFHGPVRLREALGNSLNVPAVWTAEAVGPARVLDRLRALGFGTLNDDAEHYGVAIALGDVDTRLVDLANAYATLARGGVLLPVVAVARAVGKDDRPISFTRAPARRVLDAVDAALVTDVLADHHARLAAFGPESVLDLPFDVAAKTGTSKGFRDNVTVGFTPDVTVAVWVGNMDGSPMEGVSGIAGAGPIFHDGMLAAMRGRPARAFELPKGAVEETSVCALSGELAGASCAHTIRETFAKGTAPRASCSMHEVVAVDVTNGLRAGPGCGHGQVERRVFERFDGPLLAWARAAGRPLAPEASSPRCPAREDMREASGRRVRVAFPMDGAAFAIDPALRSTQAIDLRADAPASVHAVRFVVDGRSRVAAAPFVVPFALTPGHHTVRVEADGAAPDEASFDVD
jgi:penicillin-binding protein 1C